MFEGVSLLGDYSQKTKDEILAQGELLSVKLLSGLLNTKNIKALAVDSRELIKTDGNFGNAKPIANLSKDNVKNFYKNSQNDPLQNYCTQIEISFSLSYRSHNQPK